MEFKDKLKKLRQEKGLSQKALADAIFVSRSAVAKWENGLGYPSAESLEGLASYFSLSADELKTENAESVIAEKNRRLKYVTNSLMAFLLLFLTAFPFFLLFLLTTDDCGFTSRAAAGAYSDELCIRTKDYDFYLEILFEGEAYASLNQVRAVRRQFIWYSAVETGKWEHRTFYDGERAVCDLYTLSGSGCYYNFLLRKISPFPAYLLAPGAVEIDGEGYSLLLHSYFVTDFPVTEFSIAGILLHPGT